MAKIVKVGAVAGVVAAMATTVVAAAAQAVDVSLEVDGKAIPTSAFGFWTVVGAALGIGIAALVKERRRFLTVTLVATALSLVPAVALADDGATAGTLVAAHLVAAAIVIPALAAGSRPAQFVVGEV